MLVFADVLDYEKLDVDEMLKEIESGKLGNE